MDLDIPQNYWEAQLFHFRKEAQLFHFRKFVNAHTGEPRVYTHFPYAGANPRQSGLPTALDQTSLFWKLAVAAKGYLPAVQTSLASQHTLMLHCQDTAAR